MKVFLKEREVQEKKEKRAKEDLERAKGPVDVKEIEMEFENREEYDTMAYRTGTALVNRLGLTIDVTSDQLLGDPSPIALVSTDQPSDKQVVVSNVKLQPKGIASSSPGMGGWSIRAFSKTDADNLMPENVPDTMQGR